jgi:hypothetical protein
MTPLPPVTAWKLASWRWSPDEAVEFTGLAGTTYQQTDWSRCRLGCPPGKPLAEHHRCGFYGWRHRRRGLTPDPRRVELRVALGGVVREYAFGYRAGRQRVLAVHVPPVCRWCQALATGLDSRSLAPVCERCARQRFDRPMPVAAVRDRTGLDVWWLSSALLRP